MDQLEVLETFWMPESIIQVNETIGWAFGSHLNLYEPYFGLLESRQYCPDAIGPNSRCLKVTVAVRNLIGVKSVVDDVACWLIKLIITYFGC